MAKKKKTPLNKKDRLWSEAKRRCRLNNEDIRIAKEMGLNPRSLIKNIPSKTEQWKLSVKDWIREMYRKRQEKAARKKAHKGHAAVAYPATDTKQLPEDSTTCLEDEDFIFEEEDHFPDHQEIQDENHAMLGRQEQFHIAAKHVTDHLSSIPEVRVSVSLVPARREKISVGFPDVENPGFYSSMKALSLNQRIWMMIQVLFFLNAAKS